MQQVTLDKEQLLNIIRKNRGLHVTEYRETYEGWLRQLEQHARAVIDRIAEAKLQYSQNQEDIMKFSVVVPMLLLSCLSVPSEAQTWSGVFAAVQGTRVDYFPDARGFQSQEDEISHWRFEFRIPAEGSNAYVRLIPSIQENKPIEDYEAFVISRNDDMIALTLRYSINPKPEKIEVYTLYPKLGIGFLTDVSAFLGNYRMKELAAGNPKISHASAKVIPLRRIDQ